MILVSELTSGMLTTPQLFGFLKFDQCRATPSGETEQGAVCAMKRIDRVIRESQVALVEQGKVLFGFTVIARAFLPLNFCIILRYFTSAHGNLINISALKRLSTERVPYP